MSFHEMDDTLWHAIQPYLPLPKPHIRRPRADERGLFYGILYVLSTGCTWFNVPRQYGTKSTVHGFHLYLCHHGIYDEIFTAMRQTPRQFAGPTAAVGSGP